MSFELDFSLFDFEKGGTVYTDGWAGLKAAQAIPKNVVYNTPYNMHFYWRVGSIPFGYKQQMAIKAAVVTQDIRYCRIHLWSNIDLHGNKYFDAIERWVDFHIYDPVKEAVDTSLEGLDEILTRSDHLSWVDGDLFRLLILHKYGGVYVDMDMLLLRDLAPLLSVEFQYQWGTEKDKINGAIVRMFAGSTLSQIFLGYLPWTPCSEATTDWGSTLYSAVRQVYKHHVIFPCAFFNTEWQVGWNQSESAHPFRAGEQSKELFDGAFAWHYHNKWDHPIEAGCKFDILATKINSEYERKYAYMIDRKNLHLGGNFSGGDPSTWNPELWQHLIDVYKPKTVLDVGCGQGHAVVWFQDHGIRAIGFDGLAENLKGLNEQDGFYVCDLTKEPFEETPVDLVWCSEVVEHIAEEHIDNLITSLSNGNMVAMTFATPGQDGWHHVNCQPKEYWIDILDKAGYQCLERETEHAKQISRNGWFKKNGLLFVKRVEHVA
jgi:2-polyprenyl-3-methyl-5-hydroxy-6-metoxy-1,4-benzoquinol methylase